MRDSLVEDQDLWPLLVELLNNLHTELGRTGADTVNTCILAPGQQVPWDETCGMGWVRLVSAFPSTVFPSAEGSYRASCVATLVANVEVGVLRCAPNPEQLPGGELIMPSTAEQYAATRLQLSDMAAVRRAIQNARIDLKLLGAYSPVGPQGGYVGGSWAVSVGRE
jgi:hypothetical protein